LRLEVPVRLAAVDDTDQVTAVVGDRATLHLEVRARVARLLGELADRVRRDPGLRDRTAREDLPDGERDATTLELPLDDGAGTVRRDRAVVALELLELLGLAEGERTRGRQEDRLLVDQ